MGTALRRCRDAEVFWEERTEIDLADPEQPRHTRGWGIRVNLEGKLGWRWGALEDTPERLLEGALQDARKSSIEAILFSHGLPFTGQASTPDPIDPAPHLERLSRLVARLQFLVPSLVPEQAVSIRAGLRTQQVCLVTRAGEQFAQRVLYRLGVHSTQGAPLTAELLASRLRESPSELLCQLAWRAANSNKPESIKSGDYPAVWTEAACAALLRDLVSEHFDSARFLNQPELAAPWGENWLSPEVTIQDDGTLPSGPGTVAFDGEGVARKPVSLVQNGAVHHHLTDRLHARALGVGASGLAVRPWGEPPRPGWSNLSMLPGRSSLGDLAHQIGDGIILDHLVPCGAEREPGEFCRLAQIAFRLKNGRPVERLKPFIVRGNLQELLGTGLLGLGSERAWHHRCFTPPLATSRVTVKNAGSTKAQEEKPGDWW